MAAVTMQLLLVVGMLLSSSLSVVESEYSIIAPIPSQLPNEKFDLQTIQECTSSFLDVKECLHELFNFFHGGAGLPGGAGGGGPPEEGGGGPPEEGGGEPPEGGGGGPPDDGGGGGGGGVLQGMGSGLPIPGIGGGGGGYLPGIGGGGDIISPVCCKAISGIKKNCWPIVFPNPLVAPMIDGICGPS